MRTAREADQPGGQPRFHGGCPTTSHIHGINQIVDKKNKYIKKTQPGTNRYARVSWMMIHLTLKTTPVTKKRFS